MATSEVKYHYLFLCYCLQVLLQLSCTQSSLIKVDSDGGYTNIVIAIPDRTEPMDKVAFQSYFEEASKILYTATNSRLFFKEIHVLIPSSWNNAHDSNSTFETYYDADIRVDKFNPLQERGDLYTQQPRGCGKGGDFIYLNPSVIDNWMINKNETEVYQFVQEWAKFRYGIFEETGRNNSLYPNTYQNSSGQFLTECTAGENKYSIMAHPTRHGKEFCNETHNKFAPNMQNALCDYKSTLEIINSHPDYTTMQGLDEKFIPPVITFVKSSPLEITFIIDPSLWNKDNKESLVKIFVKKFINDLPKGSKVHCIFANGNPLNHTSNTAEQIFSSIENIVNSLEVSMIKLKDAINLGLSQQFLSNTNYLVIVSNLNDLNSEELTTTLWTTVDKINLFLFTLTNTTEKLPISAKKVAEFINSSSRRLWLNIKKDLPLAKCDSKTLLQTMDAIALYVNKFGSEDFYPKTIKIQDYLTNSKKVEKFFLPAKEDKVITFIYYGCNNGGINNVNLKLNGILIDRSNLQVEGLVSWTKPVTGLENGIVYFHIDAQVNRFWCSVWLQKDSIENNLLDGKIEKVSNKTFSTSAPVIIYAFSPQNYILTAELIDEDGMVGSVKLLDNGNGDPDVLEGDKIYSGYFFNESKEDHLYYVRIIATDNKNNIIHQQSLGSVYIESSDITQFPPNRILDFHVTFINENSTIAQFFWTAPGAALDKSKASNYYIKCDSDFRTIETLEAKNVMIQQENKLNISSPLTSGEKESFNWEIPSPNTVYFCVIIAGNKHNKYSKSNIASVFLKVEEITSTISTTTCENYTPSATSAACMCTGPLIGIGVLSGLVVILLGVIIYLLRKTKLETILRNPMSNFNPKPPRSRPDITELPTRPQTDRETNDYQANQPSTFKPAEQTINQAVEVDDKCVYEQIGGPASRAKLNHGKEYANVNERNKVRRLPSLPLPK